MSNLREPSIHNVATTQVEVSCITWLRVKVVRNLADPRPQIPHDEVERRIAERIAALKVRRNIP